MFKKYFLNWSRSWLQAAANGQKIIFEYKPRPLLARLRYTLYIPFNGFSDKIEAPKTINEKKLEEEQKLLEEKQKKFKIEYNSNAEDIKNKFKCTSKEDFDEQLDCYR